MMQGKQGRDLLTAIVTVAAICLLGAALMSAARVAFARMRGQRATSAASLPAVDVLTYLPAERIKKQQYPTDVLFVSSGRAAYENGSLLLSVPRLGLTDVPVQNGTGEAELARGPGLYDVAQLPNDVCENPNVSIAAHRGAFGCEFYDIDRLGAGDVITLTYQHVRYIYVWHETRVVDDSDWSPIHCRAEACVTLTSCHPKGHNAHRICAIGLLQRIEAA